MVGCRAYSWGVCHLPGWQGRRTQGKVAASTRSSGEGSLQTSVLTSPHNNSLVVVACLGNYLKPLQHELGNKAPVVFSVIPKKILLVFNR